MNPAREPASSRPKPCASLKTPHESCPFAAPCGPRTKKNDCGQTSAFPQKSPGSSLSFSRTGVQHSPGSSTIEPPSAFAESGAYPPDRELPGSPRQTVLPASRVQPPSQRAPNWSSEKARTWEHHPHLTIPPPRSTRQAESRRQPVGCISRGRARSYTSRKEPPTLTPRNQQVSEGEGTRSYTTLM